MEEETVHLLAQLAWQSWAVTPGLLVPEPECEPVSIFVHCIGVRTKSVVSWLVLPVCVFPPPSPHGEGPLFAPSHPGMLGTATFDHFSPRSFLMLHKAALERKEDFLSVILFPNSEPGSNREWGGGAYECTKPLSVWGWISEKKTEIALWESRHVSLLR